MAYYRKGTVRVPKKYTVTLTNEEGKQLYKRDMVSGIIKNMPHFISSLIDGAVMVDEYLDCGFGDLDMVAEINGNMLNIEFKGNMHKLLKGDGQLSMAINMAETSNVTTFFVEGNSDNPKRIFVVSHFDELNDYTIKELNGIDGLNAFINEWQWLARNMPKISTADKLAELKQALKEQL